jgi:hypothetical protein
LILAYNVGKQMSENENIEEENNGDGIDGTGLDTAISYV